MTGFPKFMQNSDRLKLQLVVLTNAGNYPFYHSFYPPPQNAVGMPYKITPKCLSLLIKPTNFELHQKNQP